MRRLQSLIVLSVTAVLLAGCATATAGAAPGIGAEPTPSSTSSPTPSPTATIVDPEAAAKADSWLEGAVLPPGTVRSENVPSTTPPFANSYYRWPCSPMELRTGYWTLEGANVVDTGNWLRENPTAGLIASNSSPYSGGPEIDSLSLGNVPEWDSLEGIAYTVSRTSDGVAIRAEIGVFMTDTVCTPPPGGGMWGGPGQG
ncbi:hypothetical protein [Microbacterium sp. Root61]|uniref:hypothetical protein n=1 Tax=Microbacterium sp. Root61 TaxID=1736570 RepID=UPI0012E3791A|nr:hypothetical protein [Microbacterium sp. Root61]